MLKRDLESELRAKDNEVKKFKGRQSRVESAVKIDGLPSLPRRSVTSFVDGKDSEEID